MPTSKKTRSSKHKTETKKAAAVRAGHEIGFVLDYMGAEHVHVCGDFNQWQPVCLRRVGGPDDGLWEKRLVLAPGRYEYKFVVDGKWLHDPEASQNVPNIHGSLNSVLEV